jgi:hypothetical protein
MSPSGAHIFLFCAPAARIIGRRFTRPCVRVVYAPHIAALPVILIETCALWSGSLALQGPAQARW